MRADFAAADLQAAWECHMLSGPVAATLALQAHSDSCSISGCPTPRPRKARKTAHHFVRSISYQPPVRKKSPVETQQDDFPIHVPPSCLPHPATLANRSNPASTGCSDPEVLEGHALSNEPTPCKAFHEETQQVATLILSPLTCELQSNLAPLVVCSAPNFLVGGHAAAFTNPLDVFPRSGGSSEHANLDKARADAMHTMPASTVSALTHAGLVRCSGGASEHFHSDERRADRYSPSLPAP